ncbi:hypothetical protein DPMN_054376 [Dreissena polymorpha]|uniref:Uncharacterized protein n=1 Tax=Dreissena polymorpha TaxID=45954 RepID=A0A9D4CQF9_DREPO|nr:hypothetical protein DPMN_054376 [Dreissena polymorpha]
MTQYSNKLSFFVKLLQLILEEDTTNPMSRILEYPGKQCKKNSARKFSYYVATMDLNRV